MKFKDLPISAKVAIVITFFNTWVMIEEFIIDRFGYWKYLPFYKKGIFCIWDISFLILVSMLFIFKSKISKYLCFINNCKICLNKN
jgi:hypothetical protein